MKIHAFSLLVIFTLSCLPSFSQDSTTYQLGPAESSSLFETTLEYLGTYNGTYITLQRKGNLQEAFSYALIATDIQTLERVDRKNINLSPSFYQGMISTQNGTYLYFRPKQEEATTQAYLLDYETLAIQKSDAPVETFTLANAQSDFSSQSSHIRFPTAYNNIPFPQPIEHIQYPAQTGQLLATTKHPLYPNVYNPLTPEEVKALTADQTKYKLAFIATKKKEPNIIQLVKEELEEMGQTTFEIPVGDYYLFNPIIFENHNRHLVCTGYFSETKRKPKFKTPKAGVFHLTIDPTNGQVLQKSFFNFSLAQVLHFISEDEYKAQKEKADTYRTALSLELGITNMYMSRIIQRADGGYTIIHEQHRTKKVVPLPGLTRLASGDADPMSRTNLEQNREYTSYDILLTTVSAEGTLLWEQMITRRSIFYNYSESWSGYALGFDGENLHFIFNDHVDNQDLIDSEEEKFYSTLDLNKNLSTVHVTIGADGQMERNTLALRGEIEVDFRVNRFFQPDSQTLIVEGTSRPEDALFNLYQKSYTTQYIRIPLSR
ncbi:MAG: hypothetical protein AAFW00_02805 [Bacteroidota bacterium]